MCNDKAWITLAITAFQKSPFLSRPSFCHPAQRDFLFFYVFSKEVSPCLTWRLEGKGQDTLLCTENGVGGLMILETDSPTVPHCPDSPWLLSSGLGCPRVWPSISTEFWIIPWHVYIYINILLSDPCNSSARKAEKAFFALDLTYGKIKTTKKGNDFHEVIKKKDNSGTGASTQISWILVHYSRHTSPACKQVQRLCDRIFKREMKRKHKLKTLGRVSAH